MLIMTNNTSVFIKVHFRLEALISFVSEYFRTCPEPVLFNKESIPITFLQFPLSKMAVEIQVKNRCFDP